MKGWQACGAVLTMRYRADDFSLLLRAGVRRLTVHRGTVHLLH